MLPRRAMRRWDQLPPLPAAAAACTPTLRSFCARASANGSISAHLMQHREQQQQQAQQAPARKRRKIDPMTPPPPASEFPAWEPRDFFRFELLHT